MLTYFSRHSNLVLAASILLSIAGAVIQFTQHNNLLVPTLLTFMALIAFIITFSFPLMSEAINKMNSKLINQDKPHFYQPFMRGLFYLSFGGCVLSIVGLFIGDIEAPFTIAPTSGLFAGICRHFSKIASVEQDAAPNLRPR